MAVTIPKCHTFDPKSGMRVHDVYFLIFFFWLLYSYLVDFYVNFFQHKTYIDGRYKNLGISL